MVASITDPGLMNVLIENPNSVFVIEVEQIGILVYHQFAHEAGSGV